MGRIVLDNVSKSFGHTEVIPPLDLTIEEGEFAVFVGPSGCGKSTLLRLIAGLEDVTGGVVRINDQDATDVPPAKRGLAMVFQSYALYPHMSVRKNIAFPLRMAKLDRAKIKQLVEDAASVLNLTDYLDRKPGQLSGGQRQRVAIGRAIVREPEAFLFDEPLSNLDAALRVGMRLEISELHKRLATTMIYVTHDQEEALTMSDRIAVMSAGELQQLGSATQIYEEPANRFVADFIGETNLIDATVVSSDNGEVLCELPGGFTLQAKSADNTGLPAGSQGAVSIRPERLSMIAPGAAPATADHSVLHASLIDTTYLGTDTLYNLKLTDIHNLSVRVQNNNSQHTFKTDDQVAVSVEAAQFLAQ